MVRRDGAGQGVKARTYSTASACDRERVREFERARAFANVDAGHAKARADAVKPLPFRLRRDLLRDWASASVGGPAQWNEATRQLNERARYITGHVAALRADATVARIEARDELHAHSSDESVRAWARRRAGECGALVGGLDDFEAFAAAKNYAARWCVGEASIRLPKEPAEGQSVRPFVARLCCAKWWRRAARVMLGRGIEAKQIDDGRVHRRAGVYLSDRNAERGQLAAKRNSQLLLGMDAENELGERVNLAELAKGSISNPWVRFSEMMVALKGLESIADAGRWRGLFLTWTLPSRFHARLSESGAPNPAYDPTLRPRQGQERFRELWARARAQLARWKAQAFGLRVAEPHHDGTPHWHLLVWVRPKFVRRVLESLRSLALEDSPDEPGAAEHRFKVERIRRREGDKGGAASYLAKYVAKMTTGGTGNAIERGADGVRREVGAPSESARRARWWASLHGIRQFQFFGIPPRGVWREARRVRAPLTIAELPQAEPSQLALLEAVRATADAGDYAGHVAALGGVALPRSEYAVQLLKQDDGLVGQYGEPMGPRPIGLHVPGRVFSVGRPRFAVRRRKFGHRVMRQTLGAQAEAIQVDGAVRVVTRLHVWTIKPARSIGEFKGLESGPWTRVNNCTDPSRADPFPDSPPDPGADSPPDWWDAWFPGEKYEAPRC